MTLIITSLKRGPGPEGSLHFSNGAYMDYSYEEDISETPHRFATAIHMNNAQLTEKQLFDDYNALMTVHYMVKFLPSAYRELLADEMLEYLFWLTNEEMQKLVKSI